MNNVVLITNDFLNEVKFYSEGKIHMMHTIKTLAKKIFLFNASLIILLLLIGCSTLGSNNKQSLPPNLDQWMITETHVYHLSANGINKAGVFKPWYELKRNNNQANKRVRFMLHDQKRNCIYFIVTDFGYKYHNLYRINLDSSNSKPTLLTNANNIERIWLVNDRLYFTTGKYDQYKTFYYVNLNDKRTPQINVAFTIKHKFSKEYSFSPNGKMFAFIENGRLWVMDLHSQTKRLIEPYDAYSISWISNHELFCHESNKKYFIILDINSLKEQRYSVKPNFSLSNKENEIYYYPIGVLPHDKRNMLIETAIPLSIVRDVYLFDLKQRRLTKILGGVRKSYNWLPNGNGVLILDQIPDITLFFKQSLAYFSVKNKTYTEIGKIVPSTRPWVITSKINTELLLPNDINSSF